MVECLRQVTSGDVTGKQGIGAPKRRRQLPSQGSSQLTQYPRGKVGGQKQKSQRDLFGGSFLEEFCK